MVSYIGGLNVRSGMLTNCMASGSVVKRRFAHAVFSWRQ